MVPAKRPEYFDAVVIDGGGRVLEIQVKRKRPTTRWVWGSFKLLGSVFIDLHALWLEHGRKDEYIGTLVNRYISGGGEAVGVRAGSSYVDVGTINGYREAIRLLSLPGRPRGDR